MRGLTSKMGMALFTVNSLACLLVVLSSTLADPIHFKDCTDGQLTLSVDINPCPTQPCAFGTNSSAIVTVNFRSPLSSPSLAAKIYGYVAGVRVPWKMPKPDGCLDSNITCPVTEGQVYTYVSILAMPQGAPKIRLVVEWVLIGSEGEKQFCFDFPMSIT